MYLRKFPVIASNLLQKHRSKVIINCCEIATIRLQSKNMSINENITQTFEGKTDRYNGVTVISIVENCSAQELSQILKNSIDKWIETKKRCIWFKVALEHADWVPVLAENGFVFHHAQRDYVLMTRWLPTMEQCQIPHYAHTMLGVGAIVVNNKNQILIVKEKYFLSPHWKLPGGYVEEGENIVDAAIREVYEETNIHAEFKSLVSLRHAHGGQYNCSDLYVVVSLKPLNDQIEKCEREIMAAEWMDLEECVNNQEHMHELNRFFLKKYLEQEKSNLKIDCRHGIHQLLKKHYTVYSICQNSSNVDESKL